MEIPEGRWPAFQVALHQFVMPVVDLAPDNKKIRMSDLSFLREVNEIAIASLDTPSVGGGQPSHPSSTSSRYKNVGKVLRPPLPPTSQPAPEHRGQSQAFIKPPQTTSTKKANRTKRTTEDEGLTGGEGSDEGGPAKKRKMSQKTTFFRSIKRRCECKLGFFRFFALLSGLL